MTVLFSRERTARTNTIETCLQASKPSFTAKITYCDGYVIARSFWDLGEAFDWISLNG